VVVIFCRNDFCFIRRHATKPGYKSLRLNSLRNYLFSMRSILRWEQAARKAYATSLNAENNSCKSVEQQLHGKRQEVLLWSQCLSNAVKQTYILHFTHTYACTRMYKFVVDTFEISLLISRIHWTSLLSIWKIRTFQS